VEDDEAVGLNLAAAAEDVGASVVGPIASVAEALRRIDHGGIDGAVIDVRLQDRDSMPVILRLIERSLPFVVHSGFALPDKLAAVAPESRLVMKPADPEAVMNQILRLVAEVKAGESYSASALRMMEATLPLLDAAGETVAAAFLSSAMDQLIVSGEVRTSDSAT
jgi:DNA-binding NtrC family response regulator